MTDILLNADGDLWVESRIDGLKVMGKMSAPNALSLLGTIADSLNTTINRDNPVVEGELFIDGSRVEGIIPPIVPAPIFAIRKRAAAVISLEQYVSDGIMSARQAEMIVEAVKNRENILVAGGTGSGKTTLINAIIQSIHVYDPDQRLVIIEDTSELQPASDNVVQLRTSLNVDMTSLLRATLRLRPDRIIVGEVRGPEALALLKCWNTGHPGGAATVHANGAEAALIRIEQLVAESGMAIGCKALVAEAVGLIVAIDRHLGQRKVTELRRVVGLDEKEIYITEKVD